MEKNLVSLMWGALLCGAFLHFGCSSSGGAENQAQMLQGTVYVAGNEPFTRLALVADDGMRYILNCSKEIEESLNRSQGKKFRIRFSGKEQGPDGPVLRVISVDPAGE